ncbi:response regulator receiver protein [Calothrix sp. NIES-4071]|nr:response regulator receiver protein [Calothrix sp. NIES-4071]BAZ54574.1 response regulator receiver protein [Calothrix sp. NIES-4105]
MYVSKDRLAGCRLLAGLRILILEDELDHLVLLTYILQVEGASVIAAITISELAKQLKSHSIDIMFVSIKTIKEYTFAKQTKITDVEILKKIPKIGVVDSDRNLDLKSIQDLGCSTHFSKPFDADEIIRLILSNIEQSRFYQQLENITNTGIELYHD